MKLGTTLISLGISVLLHALVLWSFRQPPGFSVPLKNSVSSISVVMMPTKQSNDGANHQKSEVQKNHSSGVVEESSPELLKPLNPEYPWRSRVLGEEGEVEAVFKLSRDGKPYNIRISSSSGYKRLDESAVAAIALAEYKIEDEVSEDIEIALNFKLREKK